MGRMAVGNEVTSLAHIRFCFGSTSSLRTSAVVTRTALGPFLKRHHMQACAPYEHLQKGLSTQHLVSESTEKILMSFDCAASPLTHTTSFMRPRKEADRDSLARESTDMVRRAAVTTYFAHSDYEVQSSFCLIHS
jgi:hypothetical protein